MGFKRIFNGLLYGQFLGLWRISIYLTIVFSILYYTYNKLIFLILAIVSFVSIFIFNSISDKQYSRVKEINKTEYTKNPKKYTSEFLLFIIILVIFFIGGLTVSIINSQLHAPSERPYDYTWIGFALLIGIIIFTIFIKQYYKMKRKQIS